MEEQEKLKDYQGNPPEVSFYKYQRTPKADPVLIFRDDQGIWKARYYFPSKEEIKEIEINQPYFEYCVKVSDDDIKKLITNCEKRTNNLKDNLEMKAGLEDKTQAGVES